LGRHRAVTLKEHSEKERTQNNDNQQKEFSKHTKKDKKQNKADIQENENNFTENIYPMMPT